MDIKLREMNGYVIHSPKIRSCTTKSVHLKDAWKAENVETFCEKIQKHAVKSLRYKNEADAATSINMSFSDSSDFSSTDKKRSYQKKIRKRDISRSDEKKDVKKPKNYKYLRSLSFVQNKTKGHIKKADVRDFIKAKDFTGNGFINTPESAIFMGAPLSVKYKNESIIKNCRSWRIHAFSQKDKVTVFYPIGKKSVAVEMSRKKFGEMMDMSFKGRLRTYTGDFIGRSLYNEGAFVHRLSGSAGRSLLESSKNSLSGNMKSNNLSDSTGKEMLESPSQIKKVSDGLKNVGSTTRFISKNFLKGTSGSVRIAASTVKGGIMTGKAMYRGSKKFVSATKAQQKKMVQQAMQQTMQAAQEAAKKIARKVIEKLMSFIIKLLGTLIGTVGITAFGLLLPILVIIITVSSLSNIIVSTTDGDSIDTLNGKAVVWEAESEDELSAYAQSLPQPIEPPCPFGWKEKSWYFVFHASDVEDEVDSLWNATIASYGGAINADPDIGSIVDGWGLEERDFEDTWINTYVLTSIYFNYDIGKLGGSTEDYHEYSKDEILAVAEDIYDMMCNEVQEENAVTMVCWNYIQVPYDSDGDDIDDDTYPVLHTHGYTYYAVFRGIRSFDEMLPLMPWHTDTYNYCMQYDSEFPKLSAEEQSEYLASFPEKKDAEAKDYYAELIYSMSVDEEADVSGLNEDWKGLLNIRSTWDDMSSEEFNAAYESFPVINMTRAEFVDLVKGYCEPSGQIPYLFGGKSYSAGWNSVVANGLDCTGFVDWIYRTAGEPVLQSGAGEMWYNTYSIREAELQIGDLVWKTHPYETDVTHVGIFLGYDDAGNKLFGHCASGSGTIINSYDKFKFYRRPCVRFLDDLENYEPETEP